MIRPNHPVLSSVCCALLLGLFLAASPARAEEEVLCPDIDIMKKSAPGDIAGVQADIERLNLCVERARLLKQLDEVIQARQAMLKKITTPDVLPTGAISTGMAGGIPPLPISALPPLKGDAAATNAVPKDLKPGEVRITNAAGNAFDRAQTPSAAPNWQIRKIWGQGVGMRAQLSDANSDTLLNVVKGDPLPDGGTVETISVKGVAISRNGKINDLSWEQVTPSESKPQNAKVVP